MTQDERFLRRAYDLALDAERSGEVPVGAVLVDTGGVVLAEAFNSPIRLNDPTAHAEMLVLRAAGSKMSNYRLPGTTLYVTLEPCDMCIGATFHARVGRIVFGATDPKKQVLRNQVKLEGGLLAQECGALLSNFFAAKR